MRAYRIVLEKFGATAGAAFSGRSGYSADGRWHSRGRHLDYTSESRSLATLERLVHYQRFDCLTPHVIYTLDLPEEFIETVLSFPSGWNGTDLLAAAQRIGDDWCDTGRSPALQVPSAVTPGEHNFLVNTRHPAWDWRWIIDGPGRFEFDGRLTELMERPRPRRT